jgi:hypothetical protein
MSFFVFASLVVALLLLAYLIAKRPAAVSRTSGQRKDPRQGYQGSKGRTALLWATLRPLAP